VMYGVRSGREWRVNQHGLGHWHDHCSFHHYYAGEAGSAPPLPLPIIEVEARLVREEMVRAKQLARDVFE
jgi:hypothetical protein